ncbi:MAG: prolipoprotein diacylglyceryl transferase [Deltaproteobacteria bacterium]|nr:prolipoprotein diacylglyceryl transferase [Deltaproteobacteria bacterium]
MSVRANVWTIPILGHLYNLSPYILFNGLGLIVGLFLLDSILAKEVPSYQNKIYITLVFSVVAGWLGAYVFDWLIGNNTFFHSGFTFYGGLIAGLIFYLCFSYTYLPREIIWPSLNAAVIPLLCAHAIGRVGCFFSGCCYGKDISANNLLSHFFNVHPTQLYEALFLFSLALSLYEVSKRHPLSLVYIYLSAYSLFRFFVEFLRGDDRAFYYGLSTSQWISIIVLLSIITLAMRHKAYIVIFRRRQV